MAETYDMGERPRMQYVGGGRLPETLVTCVDIVYPDAVVIHRTDTADGGHETLKLRIPALGKLLDRFSDDIDLQIAHVALGGRGAGFASGRRWKFGFLPVRRQYALDTEQHRVLWEAVTEHLKRETGVRRRMLHDMEQQLAQFKGASS
jgi:hypothetical protein